MLEEIREAANSVKYTATSDVTYLYIEWVNITSGHDRDIRNCQ